MADEQSRFIEGVFSVKGGAIRVCSLYLPNGNPAEKFPYKLSWMERLSAFAHRLALEEPLILAGDYNVIAEPHDCWDVKVWQQRRAIPAAHPSGIPAGWKIWDSPTPSVQRRMLHRSIHSGIIRPVAGRKTSGSASIT